MKYKSSQAIIAKVFQRYKQIPKDSWEDMIVWIGEALEGIEVPLLYEKRNLTLNIVDFKAMLPTSFLEERAVMYLGKPIYPIQATIAMESRTEVGSSTQVYGRDEDGKSEQVDYGSQILSNDPQPGYEIDNCFFKTNFREGTVTIAGMFTRVDADGFPMVPDHFETEKAMIAYIVMRHYEPQYLEQQMAQAVWNDIEMKWENSCGQARNNLFLKELNLPGLEVAKNVWQRLIPDINKASRFFNDLGAASIHSTR